MAYKGPDRQVSAVPDGFAKRSAKESMSNDNLDHRAADTDEEVAALCASGKKTLLNLAGFTTEKAAAEPSPVAVPAVEGEAPAPEPELSPEQTDNLWLSELKGRFDAIPKLHEGVSWADVEKSLRADPEAMRDFQKWDKKGHKVNVFDEKNGKFVFASAWTDVETVSADHRNIVSSKKAQEWLKARYPDETYNGNATDIAESMGGKLAPKELHEKLKKLVNINGWAYLETGVSFDMYWLNAFNTHNTDDDRGSLRVVRSVKKV